MSHQIKTDAANFELSIEQLDEVAGGNIFGDIGRWITRQIKSIGQNPAIAGLAGGLIVLGGILSGGSPTKLN